MSGADLANNPESQLYFGEVDSALAFALAIVTSLFGLISAYLGIKEAHHGRRPTKRGRMLLIVTMAAGVVSMFGEYENYERDKEAAIKQETSRSTLQEKVDQEKTEIDQEKTELDQTNTLAINATANERVADEELKRVEGDLDRARTPVSSASISWVVWLQTDDSCISELVAKSTPSSDDDAPGTKLTAEPSEYMDPAPLSSLSSVCNKELAAVEFRISGLATHIPTTLEGKQA